MKVVKIQGGLGNQMFQYAFYMSLKQKYKDCCIDIRDFETYTQHNGFELDRVFENIRQSISLCRCKRKFFRSLFSKFLNRFIKYHKNYFSQDDFGFNKKYYNKDNCYLDGYWQSEKYFKSVEKQIREIFKFQTLDDKNAKILEEYKNRSLVSIHVRRGDYINHPLHGDICNLDYYNNAIDIIKSRVESPHFFVFSDDIEWCKQCLDIEDVTYICTNTGSDSYRDMQIMSICKHNIIANSSFSWWGAWLNQNSEKIIIAPNRWFNDDSINQSDICPESWIKI
ncbi:hypothetical protein LO80_02610 [Candidatus Francisella endociliophora]|uniref:Alpha-1,2-fucosyltransferase n=1 Tax=Candidatus Francisella endociliophora TaxID=653937 RepID=A0A097EN33_9GAMM|nr:alpha-1,2-fucosyltransferase [Francisella sp. FSC1006]AIT08976.1 hypothetical protein LO80_02610 [Francisella sp. FSC1006]